MIHPSPDVIAKYTHDCTITDDCLDTIDINHDVIGDGKV